ncbi:MAG: hypothetical protein ACO1N0_17465 [Fluviicola sp.]
MKPNFYSRGSLRGAGKLLLLSFFIALFGNAGYSQKQDSIPPVNAYYLSKDLYNYLKISDEEISSKDSEIARETLAKLFYYSGVDSASELNSMLNGSNTLTKLFKSLQEKARYVKISTKIDKIKNWSGLKVPKVVSAQQKRISDNTNVTNNLEAIKKQVDQIKDIIITDTITVKSSDIDPIQTNAANFKLLKQINSNTLQLYYKQLLTKIDSVKTEKNQIDSKSIALFDSLSPYYASALGISSIKTLEVTSPEFIRKLDNIQRQDAQITISLLESSSGSISGFKMPSEAEMIDAVATYIASRVKQETVLWFFDQMRNNTERYELIMTAFPQTMNLLQSSEVFDAPNMGSSWKYALSKDFVHLPKNILNSDWIKERIPKEQQKYLDLTCISWEIAELVSNKLSYRDMIKQLYLKRNLDDSPQIDNFPDSIITFLYAVSNELYIVSNGSVRNLTYEELSSMSFGQLEIMLELLNMKYSQSIDRLFLKRSEGKITKDHKKEIAKWIGNTMLALSQFDKIIQQVEQSQKGNGETILFDGYNTWNLISQVVRSALPARKDSIYGKYLDRADDAFEIYHLLSEKNYAGAVSKTLELVDSFIYNDYLEINPYLVGKEAPFLISPSKTQKKVFHYYRTSINNFPSISALLRIHRLRAPYSIADSMTVSSDIKRLLDKKFTPPSIEMWRRIDSNFYRITISDLDNEFLKRHIKPKKFPAIAHDLNKSYIDIYEKHIPYYYQGPNKEKLLAINPDSLEAALKKNESCARRDRIHRLFHKKFNRSEIDRIIDSVNNWGGIRVNDSLIRFPINSIAAQALISTDKKAMQMIMKLASFLNDVSLSNNEKELKKVIESYALPPGSYKQKRNSWHSLTLNAFAGPYCGFETAGFMSAKRRGDTLSSCAWNYGISAPIGITYTKTFGKKLSNTSRLPSLAKENPDFIKIKRNHLYKRTNASLSFSLTLIDIGAVVSYRMSHTENVLDQSFKWEQFISPGFNIGMAIPKTPLMVQIGYQYTPKIRRIITGQIENSDGETIRKDEQIGMWRAYAGVFFDIPLVNLWMKTRSVKFE